MGRTLLSATRKGRTKWGPDFDLMLAWCKRQHKFKFRSVVNLKSDGVKCDGLCLSYKGGFMIQLRRSLSYDAACMVLLHEVAHAVTISKYGWATGRANEHDEKFGKEYSRLYNDYLEWIGDVE